MNVLWNETLTRLLFAFLALTNNNRKVFQYNIKWPRQDAFIVYVQCHMNEDEICCFIIRVVKVLLLMVSLNLVRLKY